MPSWRVASVIVLLAAAAFGIAFGAARLLRGSASSPASTPAVVDVADAGVVTFGAPARIPALRTP
jgi:hypothetical protein